MAQRLELPPGAVERAMTSEAVVQEHVRGEAVTENAAQWRGGTQLVGGGLVSPIPAAVQQIHVAALRVEGGNSCD